MEKQRLPFVLHVHLGAEDDHRDVCNMGQNILPGQPRQHQIQQHQVRLVLGKKIQRLRAGVGPQDGIALALEQFFQHGADVNVIINNGNGFHSIHLRLLL